MNKDRSLITGILLLLAMAILAAFSSSKKPNPDSFDLDGKSRALPGMSHDVKYSGPVGPDATAAGCSAVLVPIQPAANRAFWRIKDCRTSGLSG